MISIVYTSNTIINLFKYINYDSINNTTDRPLKEIFS